MTEFTVQKITPRHPDPVKRILCLTEVTLLERDPQTYSVCTLRPLCDVFALVRDKDNLQRFCIEYKNGIVRSYSTNDRDSLLATVLDAVRSSGNQDVHIRIGNTPRGKRYVPLNSSVDEETEANLLRLVINNFQNPLKRHEILERFNANVPHSGLNYSVTQDVSSPMVAKVMKVIIHFVFFFCRVSLPRTRRSSYLAHCRRWHKRSLTVRRRS